MKRRHQALAVLASLAVLPVLASCSSPARPTGNNRQPLTHPPMVGRCSPLPSDVRFDFPRQARSVHVRRTATGGARFLVVLQFDRISASSVTTKVDHALRTAGFREVNDAGGDAAAGFSFFARPDYGLVGRRVTALPDVPRRTVVKGTVELDLPRAVKNEQRRRRCPGLPVTIPPRTSTDTGS